MALVVVTLLGRGGHPAPHSSPSASVSPKEQALGYFAALEKGSDLFRAEETKKYRSVPERLNDLEDAWVQYASVVPPPGFREAHEKLLAFFKELYNGYVALDWMTSADVGGPTTQSLASWNERLSADKTDFRVAIRAAANRAGVKVPAELLSLYAQ